MNTISEQILQAADILAEEKVKQLKFDKTVQAKVYSIINLDTGEYKVRYNGNIFSAFANDLTQTYKIDDWVYVNIPEGDFSGKKLIMSLVSKQSLSQSQLTSLKNSIFEISPEFSQLYGGLYDTNKRYGVIAGAPRSSDNSREYIYRGPETFQSSGFHGLFQQYANNYELIRIQASFSTQFYSLHNKGNYGIEVEFYAKGDDVVSYKLDLNSFNGDPYRLSVASPQSTIIKVQKNYLLGLKSIKLFEEDFEYDKLVRDGKITDELNTTDPNIFVQDISLQYVDQKDLTDTNYYLIIAAPRGIAFTSNISSLDLQGRLVYMGKDIMDSNCKCKWFVRDLTVMIGEEDYDKEAGFGWRPLSQTSSSLSLVANDVPHEQRYKLLVTYNETVSLSAEIEVFNHNSGYDYKIEQRTNGADIILQLINNLNDEVLVADWYLSYPDGSYSFITDSQKQNSVSVSQYLKYSSVNFYCQVYSYDKTRIVGTLEHTITNSESDEDVTIAYVGEDTFRYDSNGDIAIEDSEKERTLQVNLTWKEGFGTAYTVQWLMRDSDNKEIPLTSKEYEPPLSMIDKLWVDNYNILHYNIKQKYKNNFNNNTLIVKIKTITEQEYLFDKEILFLKDGDQGTNGTTYVLAVRPYDKSTLLKLSGFNPILYNNGWKSTLPLRCYVYKDGELINGNSKYDINYKWTGVNISFTEHNVSGNVSAVIGDFDSVTANGQGTISSSSSSASLQFYVKVQVTVNDKMNGRKTEIYASYPIDILVGNLDKTKVEIDSIPSYIKYTASGITPQFYNNDIKFIYNGALKNGSIHSLNTKILDIEIKDSLYYLKPATNFIFENVKVNSESNVGVLKCEVSSSQYVIHPIIMYLDTYGNEAINGWDGTALDTGDGKYVFAPQVGAGVKDSFNRFTGVVMGKDSAQDKIGLYGYQAGLNTFGLMEDGTAFFGAKSGGGQIVIDGRKATISGGNGGDSSTGMTITLADLNPGKKTNAIKVGAGVFTVTYDGALTATSADILGKIYAQEGQIGCDASKRGGWKITSNRISSGSGSNTVTLDSSDSPFSIWAGRAEGGSSYTPTNGDTPGDITSPAPFVVTKDGFLYASNVRVKGNIEATSGKIANWIIKRNYLQAESGTVGMASSGNAAFWAGANLSDSSTSIPDTETATKFLVTRSGKLYCSSAEVSGKITAKSGNIGGWKITESRLESASGDVWLSATGGFQAGEGFKVSRSGKLTATGADIGGTIKADSGRIGNWSINEGTLSSGNTRLYSDGRIYCEDATITGNITATTLTAEAGSIGGWTISSNGLTAGLTTLLSNGHIKGADLEFDHGKLVGGPSASFEGKSAIRLQSDGGIAIEASDGAVFIHSALMGCQISVKGRIQLDGNELGCSVSPEKQYGIYARFA